MPNGPTATTLFTRLPDGFAKKRIIRITSRGTRHFLVNGDATAIEKILREKCVDLIVTDPPYNINLDYGPYFKDSKKKEEYFDWCFGWLRKSAATLKDDGSLYLISYPEINARLLPFLEDELKLKFRRWLTWHYPSNIGHAKRNFTRSQRSILFFTKSDKYVFNRTKITQHYRNPTVTKIKRRILNGSRGRVSDDVIRFLDLIELSRGMIDVLDVNLLKNTAKDRFTNRHPCQLPLGLMKILVQTSSDKGDVLLDPFAGTFTLSAVAASLGRNSVGIEINPQYVKLGLRRLES